jgi:hypothetical protein
MSDPVPASQDGYTVCREGPAVSRALSNFKDSIGDLATKVKKNFERFKNIALKTILSLRILM